ncbi:MAG: NAD-dependent epimerase/dehydratase family protein [Coriobacteriales bacterium]|nr:NAD-dependent epimerase/dehydratase family protein [Coriobacteriales bacterium]
MTKRHNGAFEGSSVLITGGLGFIGSNLAIRLVELGAEVTIVDNMLPEHGGNEFNIEQVIDRAEVDISDIRDAESMNYRVQGKDFVFHLAGQNDHIRNFTDPYLDVDINVRGTVVLLEACRHHNPDARVIYTGTRGEYGAVEKVPVAEDTRTNPKGLYELTSLTAGRACAIYHENHGVRSMTLRLTNVYGERSQMRHARFGVANWFIRLAIDDEPIKIFGTGTIKRDFLYIDDCVDAMLAAAATDEAYGEVFNVGNDTPSNFLEFANVTIDVAGSGSLEMVEFTPERAAQEPGDYYSDISKISRTVGWRPQTSLTDGIQRTIEFYRANKRHYW